MAAAAMWKLRSLSSVAVHRPAGSPRCTDRTPTGPENLRRYTQTRRKYAVYCSDSRLYGRLVCLSYFLSVSSSFMSEVCSVGLGDAVAAGASTFNLPPTIYQGPRPSLRIYRQDEDVDLLCVASGSPTPTYVDTALYDIREYYRCVLL